MFLFHTRTLSEKFCNVRVSHLMIMARRVTRVLNVAEKNDAAKSLADVMSRGHFSRREGYSRFNKIYEWDYNLLNQNCKMVMTSVSGHLANYDFVGTYKKWHGCDPVMLFDAPIEKKCLPDFQDIKRTLEREARQCQILVIWTDGDREGENIGYEIIDACTEVNPRLQLYRARFSEITPRSITNACQSLGPPNRNVSDAVDVRQELDLRTGAAFTRFQTLRLKKVFPQVLAESLISFGSCQFPTLGFVVDRYKQVKNFIPETFYKIKVTHNNEDGNVDFNWKRHRLFDHTACLVFYQICMENPTASVIEIKTKHKSKWRPLPMDTVELEKLASRKLRMTAKETMKIAEKLYTQGYISYPRTETNKFPKELDLRPLIEHQTVNPNWGAFAAGILQHGPNPRQGKKTDNAHPPIHPIKHTNSLGGNEGRVYELVVRHFLACCSQDAQGSETTIEIDIAEERFTVQGLMIIARNYLDVYPYDKWNAKVIPVYQQGEQFQPTAIEMVDGETSPPPLLTEADLISLMDKHGIGTDATHADHIDTIKSRNYVGLTNDSRLVPGELGIGLVDGYNDMGYELAKPDLRAAFEAELVEICEGRKDRDIVIRQQVDKYRRVFIEAVQKATKLDEALSQYFGTAQQYTADDIQQNHVSMPVRPCPRCSNPMVIKSKKDGGLMLSCTGYPDCKTAVWFPPSIEHASLDNTTCAECQPGPVHKVKFKFKRGSVPPGFPDEYVGCIGGCDTTMTQELGFSLSYLRNNTTTGNRSNTSQRNGGQTRLPGGRPGLGSQDSGYASSFSNNTITRTPGFMSTGRQRTNQRGQGQGRGNGEGSQTGWGGGGRVSTPTWNNRPPLGSVAARLNSGNTDGNAIVCNCGNDARILTVRKDGPNCGRQFYKCAGGGCDFFVWAESDTDDAPSGGGTGSSFGTARTNVSASSEGQRPSANVWGEVVCRCNQPAVKRTVQKEGANKGREFWTCPKSRDSQCGFFEWVDAAGTSTSTSTGFGGNSGFGGNASFGGDRGQRKSWNDRNNENTGNPKKRRKATCSICSQEGHTKRTCPQR
ncbi:DNA topoisomerase 3-alpha-like [Glandiceps talaboti]